MDKLRVTGNGPLRGSVRISGAKNAALPILCSSLLVKAPVTFTNVPQLNDTRTIVRLLNQMGVTASRTETHRIEIDASTLTKPVAEYDLVKTMRWVSVREAVTPLWFSRRTMVRVSFSCGTLVNVTGPLTKSDEQRIGSAAFFAPDMRTEPRSGPLPVTRNLSMI